MKVPALVLAAGLGLFAAPTRAALPPNVVALMDTTADPCDDFYQYSCGTWIKNTPLSATDTRVQASFTTVSKQAEAVIQTIVQDKLAYISEFWQSCTNTKKLEARGAKPIEKQLGRVLGAIDRGELFNLAGQLRHEGTTFIVDGGVTADLKNATTNIFWAGAASLSLPDATYYTDNDTFAELEAPYRTYITSVMKLAGFGPGGKYYAQTSPSQNQGQGQQGQQNQHKHDGLELSAIADKVIAIEKALAPWLPDYSNTDADPFEFYHPTTVVAAKTKFPTIFGKYSLGLGLLAKSSLTPTSTISLDSVDYYDKVEAFVRKTDLLDLKIYLAYSYVTANAEFLNDAFANAYFEFFSKTLNGQKERLPRERECVAKEVAYIPDVIGNAYFNKMFDKTREDNANLMVTLIEAAMGEHIATLNWLDDVTRAAAEAKLKKVANLIGHPSEPVDFPFKFKDDEYFDNVHKVNDFNINKALQSAGKPVNRQKWDMSAATVNAYYSPNENKMVFPAAILQPPFFNGTAHPAQNFGAIGVIVGHELTHGFDSSGRKYDGDGNVRNWWSDSTAVEFDKRAQCMKDEYSTIVVNGEDGKPLANVNGTSTITENIADNGGFSLSWDAYHKYIKNATNVPNIGLEAGEDDKLFFLSYAQVWCSKYRDAALLQRIKTDPHSPALARANAVIMNSDHFGPTFQCKAGTKMNPVNKCQIW